MRKIAIITGASSGIGAAAALAFAKRGVHSIVTYNSSEEGALRVVDEVNREGAVAKPLRLNVGQSGTFASFRANVVAMLEREWRTQRFDYLVNNAGFGQMATFEDTTEELFDKLTRVLLKGPYFLTQTLLPLMADGGAIVNVASNSAMTTGLTRGYSAYASMKGGLITLSRYMAKEFAPRGIRVNSVSPGATRTGMITDEVLAKYPDVIAALVQTTAFGRLGEPSDIGSVIAALASDEFRWVTGQNIEASGGFRL